MKASKKIKYTEAFLMLFMAFMAFIIIPSNLNVNADGFPVIFIEAPETVDTSEIRVFNATVFLTGSIPNAFTYQVYVTVDDSILSIGHAWVPDGNNSWIFYGKTTMTPEPVIEDNDENGEYEAVIIGSTLLLDYEGIPVSGTKLLGIIELQIKSSPGAGLLHVNNADTYVLNSDLDEVAIEKQDGQVNIAGYMPTEPSQITIAVNPTTTFPGGNVTITGQIIPDKPNVDVTIKRYSETEKSWKEIGKVKTNQTSKYKLIYSFSELDSYSLMASWIGDQTHLGNASGSVKVTVIKPNTKLEIRFADENQTCIGGENVFLPPPVPTKFNATVNNATDLYEWKIKVYYDSSVLRIDAIWLPADNILNFTGLKYNTTTYLDKDGYGNYLYCEANIIETGNGYTGNGTLFQFNVTGLFPTVQREGEQDTELEVLSAESVLKNSEGEEIPFEFENLVFQVVGVISTTVQVINPRTNTNAFTFYTEETSVETRFNATILLVNATKLYAWWLRLGYNTTLLAVTKVIQPIENVTYVFYGKQNEMNFTLDTENGTVLMHNWLQESESPFSGNALLAIIEFEILLAPANESESLGCGLRVKDAELFNGVLWQPVWKEHGSYVFKYGKTESDGDGGDFTVVLIKDYWPHIVGLIVALIAVYLVLSRFVKRRREIKYLEEEEG